MDWREIDNLAEFLGAVGRSKLNQECVLVAIVRDLLDLRQAFAAGVHFLIHKPASVVQIERCLRAAYYATVVRRRKQHREPVNILTMVRTRTQPFAEATVLNLSEGGVGLRTSSDDQVAGVHLSAGEEVDLRFPLPDTGDMLHATGTVVWKHGQPLRYPLQLHPRCRTRSSGAVAHGMCRASAHGSMRQDTAACA